jgi:hypothetical protein
LVDLAAGDGRNGPPNRLAWAQWRTLAIASCALRLD